MPCAFSAVCNRAPSLAGSLTVHPWLESRHGRSSCTAAHALPRKPASFTVSNRAPAPPSQFFDQEPEAEELAAFSSDGEYDEESFLDYSTIGIGTIVRNRGKWLLVFCAGLVLAALVIENYETLIASHVELSFFVPLIMGHGGNTGSQTVSNVIRALALRQIRWRNVSSVIVKEAVAGGIMGGLIGLLIFGMSLLWDKVSPDVALVVAISLPMVSLWSNGLAAFITMASSKLKLDPAMTSGPLVTTLVDTTGLMLYFLIAKVIIQDELYAHVVSSANTLLS
ncbi:divalent cation transporter [Haematococcus lacustris]